MASYCELTKLAPDPASGACGTVGQRPGHGRNRTRMKVPQDSSAAVPGSGVEFRLLGPLEMLVDGVPQKLGSVRVREVLAFLLLEPNQVVSVEIGRAHV